MVRRMSNQRRDHGHDAGAERKGRGANAWPRFGAWLSLAIIGVLYAVPLLWGFLVSLKSAGQASAPGLGALPRFEGDGGELSIFGVSYWSRFIDQAVANYREVWSSPIADFPLYLRNSLLVALLSVTGTLVSSSVVAYGFSRLRWRGRDAVFTLVLATMMVPQAVVIAPSYLLFRELGWIGTFAPLWAPAWFSGASSVFMLRQFFLTIPRELDEAARIDGCSHVGVFWRVILPLSRPALAAVGLFQFVASWNDFLGPLVFLNHQEQYTLQLGLANYYAQHGGTPWNLVMAFSTLVILPVLLLFLLTRRLFVEGVATQGLKE